MNAALRFAAATIAATVLTGCGISTQRTPEPIQPAPGRSLGTPAQPPEASPTGHAIEYLYFVDGNSIVRVTRRDTTQPSTNAIVKDLLAGPNNRENARGLTSALLGPSVVDSVQINAGLAIVTLATPVADTARNDEVLAYAQMVCTLTALSQISGVTFASNGKPIAVPRGDGSLSQLVSGAPVPLTAADYADLINK